MECFVELVRNDRIVTVRKPVLEKVVFESDDFIQFGEVTGYLISNENELVLAEEYLPVKYTVLDQDKFILRFDGWLNSVRKVFENSWKI